MRAVNIRISFFSDIALSPFEARILFFLNSMRAQILDDDASLLGMAAEEL